MSTMRLVGLDGRFCRDLEALRRLQPCRRASSLSSSSWDLATPCRISSLLARTIMVLGQRRHLLQRSKKAGTSQTKFSGTMFEEEEGGEERRDEEREGLVVVANDNPQSKVAPTAASHGITEWEAGFSLAKAIMGAGSFALPWAFMQMGYVAGPIFLVVLMTLSVYSLQLLIACARASGQASYVDVARSVIGSTGAKMAYAASVSASLGVCGSYLVFIAANLHSLLLDESSQGGSTLSQTSFILLVLPLAVLLSSVQDMKHFAFTSFLGDVSVVLGMLVVLIYGICRSDDEESPQDKELVAIGSLETMPLAFGAIGYLFLVHFLSLPIESSMQHPERFHGVAVKTFSTCALFSGGFGVTGYLLFGQNTQQIVLLNVQGSYFVSAVKLLLCVDLLFTYPVVMRPSIVIIENSLQGEGPSVNTKSKRKVSIGWIVHLSVCLVLGLIAAAGGIFVPAFGLLSGLVGGVSQTFLAFVLPPLLLIQQRRSARAGRDDHAGSGTRSSTISSILAEKELGLVGLGVVLILWTLVTTWNELRGNGGA